MTESLACSRTNQVHSQGSHQAGTNLSIVFVYFFVFVGFLFLNMANIKLRYKNVSLNHQDLQLISAGLYLKSPFPVLFCILPELQFR